MTTLSELYDLTLIHTRRPELQTLTESVIRIATLRAHHVDFFPRDLRVAQLNYSTVPSLPYWDFPDAGSVLLPRWRTIKGIFGLAAGGQFRIEELEWRETGDLYSSDGQLRSHIYTLLGDTLRCYFCAPTGLAEVYYYANPITSTAGYSSWIADTYPDELAAWAATIVFSRTGFLEMAAKYMNDHVIPFKETLLASHLTAEVN